ncbi:MAG: phosphoribosyl-AMP cyclohydrolase, partial [Roseomonas sp.]|nr:phosphoribosyl-AMP cyclohydrolase [Roseomonas sp.]
ITEAEVTAAQEAWCAALVNISATFEKDGQAAAKALAGEVIDAAYGYQMGAVLFKPTLTVAPQTFRPTREGALAYFVGDDPAFPNDTGFALKGWTACAATNNAVFITGETATTMGNVAITGKDGAVTTVDKTWTYVKDDAGNLRIVVHHSSLPYVAQ